MPALGTSNTMPTPELGDIAKTAAAALATLATTIFGLRAWLRRDRLAEASTDAGIDSYERLRVQYEQMTKRAMEAEAERNQLYLRLGELTGQVIALRQEISALREELQETRNAPKH
jgi:chromosome segregation ATPase